MLIFLITRVHFFKKSQEFYSQLRLQHLLRSYISYVLSLAFKTFTSAPWRSEFCMHFTNNFPCEKKSGAATLPYQVTKCLKFISYNADSSNSTMPYRFHWLGRGFSRFILHLFCVLCYTEYHRRLASMVSVARTRDYNVVAQIRQQMSVWESFDHSSVV